VSNWKCTQRGNFACRLGD